MRSFIKIRPIIKKTISESVAVPLNCERHDNLHSLMHTGLSITVYITHGTKQDNNNIRPGRALVRKRPCKCSTLQGCKSEA